MAAHRLFEAGKLIFRESDKEGLEQDLGFTETGIEIVMTGVEGGPERVGIERKAVRKVRGNLGEVSVEIFDQIGESADLVQELGAMGEQNTIEQGIHAGGALRFRADEVSGVEWGSVGDNAKVLGVFG